VLSRVFEPIRINQLELPNRVARTAHSTHYSYATVTDDFIAYHAARARGGCGLSILEAASVHPSSMLVGINWDVDGYRRLMAAIRPHGMRVFQQLWHAGHHVPGRDGVAWGPSDVPSPWGHVPVPMRQAQIDEIVQAFAEGAARCREGGLDGVEIHGAHGYLFHQFLSPLTNRRSDDYGGSLENRMRLLVRTLEAVRAAVGEDYPVGVRLSASQAPGSIGEDEQIEIVSVLEGRGLIDFLDVSYGDYYRMLTMNDAMDKPAGYELPSSARIAAAAGRVPRIVTGRGGYRVDGARADRGSRSRS
jgi:2,4-dienoyl-CoA reductase-like NADH-dependent reductase (Old Yellow Enzyme family)